MPFATSIGSVRTFVLGFALLSAGPVLAQQTTIKAKNNKVKTRTADAAGNTVSKTKEVAVAPIASAPQVVTSVAIAAPAATTVEAAAGWVADLGAAQTQAKATNRPILAVFSGSDWCKPCVMYEREVFAQPEFAAYAKDKLVLAHFDFPRQKKNQPSAAQLKLNEAAAAQLNREGDFPLAVLIAPDGKVLAHSTLLKLGHKNGAFRPL
ncbi:thioredoxin family protein [Hymenobacter antarcticus]|uniref:Thioredoxin domain-containing protein n=1 Tax=Hymenobacter antarcticus TaxID=486270 RepID=A0ABP7QHT4_9BACT